MLNLIYRLIATEHIELCAPQRETRNNIAPLINTCVPANDTIAKSPVFIAREFWNNLPPHVRNIIGHKLFKNEIPCNIKDEYIAPNSLLSTAFIFALFCVWKQDQ